MNPLSAEGLLFALKEDSKWHRLMGQNGTVFRISIIPGAIERDANTKLDALVAALNQLALASASA